MGYSPPFRITPFLTLPNPEETLAHLSPLKITYLYVPNSLTSPSLHRLTEKHLFLYGVWSLLLQQASTAVCALWSLMTSTNDGHRHMLAAEYSTVTSLKF